MPQSEHPDRKIPVIPAIIRGTVIGYIGTEQTRPMPRADAFLLVQIINNGKQELYYPATEKKLGRLKKYGVRGIEELQENYPDVYHAVVEHLKSFKPVEIKEKDNALARFEFKDIPAGWWCYIAAAYVEKDLYMHTEPRGNNGLGSTEVIHGKDLIEHKDQTIDNVVIPIEDKWLKKVKPAPKVKVNETDEGMDDPLHVKSLRIEEA